MKLDSDTNLTDASVSIQVFIHLVEKEFGYRLSERKDSYISDENGIDFISLAS